MVKVNKIIISLDELKIKKTIIIFKNSFTKSFYDFFPGYTIEQIDDIVSKLAPYDISLVEQRKNRNIPATNKKDYQRFYCGILPKIRSYLKSSTSLDTKVQTTNSIVEKVEEKAELSEEIINTTVKVQEMEPATAVEQHQDENNDQIAYEASSIDESCMMLHEILKQDLKINKDMNLSPKELTIAYLKLGYIDGKYFTVEEISSFLEVSQEDIIATTKKVLVEYKNNMNSLLDQAIFSVVGEHTAKTPYAKKPNQIYGMYLCQIIVQRL